MIPERRIGRQEDIPVNLSAIVGRVKAGDELAFDELFGYLTPRLQRFFQRRLPNDAEDLAQDTLTEMVAALPKYDMAVAGDQNRQFLGWTFTIARSVLNMELRGKIGRPATPFSDVNKHLGKSEITTIANDIGDRGIVDPNSNTEQEALQEPPLDLSPRFRERLAEMLSPDQLQVVDLRMNGKQIDQICQELGMTRRAALNRFYRAREKIEGDLIYPAGFKRVADYGENVMSHAASVGRLEAVKVLGLWYTTDEWVERYNRRRVMVEPQVLNEGYVLLNESTTKDEYGTLLGTRYTHLLRRQQGRIYIRPSDLDLFRENRQRRNKRYEAPDENYQHLSDFADTARGYERLGRAARNGDLQAVKNGTWVFAKPEDVAAFLAQPQPAQLEQRSGGLAGEAKRRTVTVFDASNLRKVPEVYTPEGFSEWFFSTAKIFSDQKLGWNKRRDLAQPDNSDMAIGTFVTQVSEWLQRKKIKMFPSYFKIANLKLVGRRSVDIASELGWTENSVTTTLSIIRKIIEENLIYPAGIVRVVDMRQEALNAAAIAGRLEAVWFLGRWYTTQDRIETYLAKRKVPVLDTSQK